MAVGSLLYVASSVLVVVAYVKLYNNQNSDNSVDRFKPTLILWIACIYTSFFQQVILLATVVKRVAINDANIAKTAMTIA